MASFDPEASRARAHDRFQRALVNHVHTALQRYDDELRGIRDLERLVAWCERRKHRVVVGSHAGGTFHASTRTFSINGHASPARRLHTLLHECGHLLVGEPKHDERFGKGWYASGSNKRRLVYRIDILDEENEAWHRGRKLAARLGISINGEAYDDLRVQCIRKYVKWVLKVEGYGKEP